MDVDEDELDEGDTLICEECGANVNVSGTAPLELTPAADDVDEEDEDDEEEDFDGEYDEDEEEEDEEEDDED